VSFWVVVSEFCNCCKSKSRSVYSLTEILLNNQSGINIHDIKRYSNSSDGCKFGKPGLGCVSKNNSGREEVGLYKPIYSHMICL
jgi:hypothetical protein